MQGSEIRCTQDLLRVVYRTRVPEGTSAAQPVPGQPGSSCPGAQKNQGTAADVLACRGFSWDDRDQVLYKPPANADFRGMTRTELIGRNGERTRFDLRYFEIAPGGYSSHEFHVHAHVVIGVRGSGILCKNGCEYPIGVHDVGFIGANEPHQMRNPGSGPFGFFCIVDHDRDTPRPVPLEQPVAERTA